MEEQIRELLKRWELDIVEYTDQALNDLNSKQHQSVCMTYAFLIARCSIELKKLLEEEGKDED